MTALAMGEDNFKKIGAFELRSEARTLFPILRPLVLAAPHVNCGGFPPLTLLFQGTYMEEPKPVELRVQMQKGAVSAVAVLLQHGPNALTIQAVEPEGSHSLEGDDKTYDSVSKAVEGAERIWYRVLPA